LGCGIDVGRVQGVRKDHSVAIGNGQVHLLYGSLERAVKVGDDSDDGLWRHKNVRVGVCHEDREVGKLGILLAIPDDVIHRLRDPPEIRASRSDNLQLCAGEANKRKRNGGKD